MTDYTDLKRRLEAATEGVTPGPWVFTEWGIDAEAAKWGELLRPVDGHIYDEYDQDSPTIEIRDEDARFIAAARQLVPEAAAAIAALEADVAHKNAALRALLAEFPPIAWDETHGAVSAIVRTETLGAARAALADQPAEGGK